MRFLVDECTGPQVADWLRRQQHDVFSVFDQARGAEDDAVLERAVTEGRILITSDKDFGELIFREKRPHRGVLLLRLGNPTPAHQIAALERVLEDRTVDLTDHFVVVTDSGVRVAGN